MRATLFAAILAVPFAATAKDRIPESDLRGAYTQCTNTCQQSRGYSYCSAMCSCMSRQMDRYWTSQQFRRNHRNLADPTQDKLTKGEIGRIAKYCREKTI